MSDKIKVALYVPTLLGGGAERVFVNLANYFIENNIEVIFITSFDKGYINQLNRSIKVKFILKKSRFGNHLFNTVHRLLISIIKLINILITSKPDYLLTTLDEANIIGYICNIGCFRKTKHIVRQASIFDKKKYGFLKEKILGKSFRSSYLVVANSPDTKESLETFITELRDKIIVIGNPIFNADHFQYLSTEDENFILDCPYILSVGRLNAVKDHLTLINAFRIVREVYDNINLIILGDGPLKSVLEKEIHNLGLTDCTILFGFQKNPYTFYKNASIFVLSSLSEGFGNVIVEALSFGKAIVSTACSGGPKYILDNGKYGILVPVKDPKSMAKAMISILDGSIVFDSNTQISRANDFSINNIGSKYLQIFTSNKGYTQ
ncbi:glycosyltransferase [Proteiniphilum sp. UBA5384]|uniref:glycosyltransferase n=1 Tax=Proteiniphilum sp. UBA5384 TaxID=1947279 RepID=UPI0025D15AE6|nr:glycosyltransferase [Proteiniphilum sp. UBA5384]